MKQINEDIKSGNFKRIYLLYGQEDYLRLQYKNKLKNAIVGDDDMNYSYYEGKGVSIPSIIDTAETLPFFSEKRLIVIENSGLLKEGGEELAEYLKEFPDTTYFVLVEREIDKRSKLYKTCQSNGTVAAFEEVDPDTLIKWVAKLLSDNGKKITARDCSFLIDMTGTDMVNVKSEVDKLIDYCADKEVVTKEDISQIVTRQISDHIFDMIAAIGNKNQTKALELYYDLLSLKESPFKILSLLGRQYGIMLQVKELILNRCSVPQMAEKIKLNPYVVKKYVEQASNYELKEIKRALNACVEADEAIKSGRMKDQIAVELLIVDFSR